MPRLYRDAIVVESWEGTHNTLCAQVGRDFAVRRLHRPWLDHLREERTFDSTMELMTQIRRDAEQGRDYFEEHAISGLQLVLP